MSLEEWLNLLKAEIGNIKEPSPSLGHRRIPSVGSPRKHYRPLDSALEDAVNSLVDQLSNKHLEGHSSLDTGSGDLTGSSRMQIPDNGATFSSGGSDIGLRKDGGKRLSWTCDGTTDQEDVISAIAPRICAIIQAFYMCCSCQTQQK